MARGKNYFGPRSGSVGNVTVYELNGQLVWRSKRRKPSTPKRTKEAMNQRTKMANVTTAWKHFEGSLKDNFELKRPGQTDYNAFVSVNLSNARVYLTKNEAEEHYCVADNFVVSQGTLKPDIEVEQADSLYLSSIAVGRLDIGPTTTIGELSKAIIDHGNGLWLSGDELLFYSNTPSFLIGDDEEVARNQTHAYFRCVRITLNPNDNAPLPRIYSLSTFCTSEGWLAVERWGAMLCAWVHRRRDHEGRLLCTNQSLAGLNPALEHFASDEARMHAIESYGLSASNHYRPNQPLPPIAGPVSENDVTTVTISVSAQPPEGGSVAGGNTVPRDTILTLSASPSPGWKFRCWNDGTLTRLRSIMALADNTFTALFEPESKQA